MIQKSLNSNIFEYKKIVLRKNDLGRPDIQTVL